MHVLVLDWGIGGIDCWARLRQAQPGWSTTYVSDAGFTPYGKVSAPLLAERLAYIIKRVAETSVGGLDAAVVACNAMSTVLASPTTSGSPTMAAGAHTLASPTFGVIRPGIALALKHGGQYIGVIGGQRTIDAAIHADALRAAGRAVIAVPAQPLSAHVEAGDLSGPAVEADVREVVARLHRARFPLDSLLLACTHYPALAPLFAAALPDVTLLDPVDALVQEVGAWAQPRPTIAPPNHRILTSGDPTVMRTSARAAFGVELPTTIEAL